MNVTKQFLALGNRLFVDAYPLYRLLYRVYKGISDREERTYLRDAVRSGMTVVDIGAGIGTYTRLLSRLVGTGGSVYAFEPSPINYARLETSSAGLENVSTIQAAVGDRTGTAGLYLSDLANVDHRTYDSKEGRRRIDISVVRLDDYFPPGQRIDFIKIDVQGYELSVLRGAQRVFRENPGVRLLMEFWPHGLAQAGVQSDELLMHLVALGMSCRPVGMGGERMDLGKASATEDEDWYCNLIVEKLN